MIMSAFDSKNQEVDGGFINPKIVEWKKLYYPTTENGSSEGDKNDVITPTSGFRFGVPRTPEEKTQLQLWLDANSKIIWKDYPGVYCTGYTGVAIMIWLKDDIPDAEEKKKAIIARWTEIPFDITIKKYDAPKLFSFAGETWSAADKTGSVAGDEKNDAIMEY